MGVEAAKAVPEIAEQVQAGNIPGATSQAVQAAGAAAFAGMAGKHAYSKGKQALSEFPKEGMRPKGPREREGLEDIRPEGYKAEPRLEPVKGAATEV